MQTQARRHQGFSLVEVLTCMGVLAILLALTLPRFGQLIERKRLDTQLGALYVDLQQARATALTTGTAVRVRFQQLAQGSCWVMHLGPVDSCSCTEQGQAQCLNPEHLLKHQWLPSSGTLRVDANVSQIAFHPRFGTASRAGTVAIASSSGLRAAHVIALTGRLRSCASAESGLSLPVCS
ncbi:type IV fimbrial biogenesis protein FimT [Inhella inkyongensis]|uniref:Type II secretion system protein H n=1 Tax=Inhella inkyongensis TaxID=392593 RepID=A0A840S5W6_9BURK|nr:GspH/FimT family pseudopilin [Inhella inkyongensis]MBB5204194.1 type IV fimbrial biogenesis protein FimT [Inhella inkyongensis]